MQVPSALAARDRWVCWRAEARGSKTTKIPYRADGRGRARTNDPKTWAPFATARDEAYRFDGIGFVLGDGVVGVDVDIPIDEPLAAEVIKRFAGTYCERSPRGRLHVFALGKVQRSGKGTEDKRFEAYDERSPRFLTVTGDRIEGTATDVTAQPEAIAWLEAAYFAKDDPADRIVQRIKADSKWRVLFEGIWDTYASQSEADLALCIICSRLTRDAALIDAVFRRSGLMREKWDQRHGATTYGEKTVAEALSRVNGHAGAFEATIIRGGVCKHVTDLEAINARYALLVSPGSPEAIIKRDEGRALTVDALGLVLGGEVVHIGNDADGNPRFMAAARFWRESYDKHTYNRIAFTNKPVPDDTLNFFHGYGVTPQPGDCSLILQHIRHVICNDDPVAAEAMLNLIAWQIQNIGKPSRVIVCLQSEQHQTGKGTLLESVLLPIFGSAGLKIERIEAITGDFNGALRGRSFIFADEATYLGDRKGAAVLKSLVASLSVSLNEKFLPRLSVPAAINVWMATNAVAPTHIEECDARYWILSVNEDMRDNQGYWTALYGEIESGGREAFLRMMLDRDVRGFKPQDDVPMQNAAKAAAIRDSRNPAAIRNWLELCVEVEAFANLEYRDHEFRQWIAGDKIRPLSLWNAYAKWCSSLSGTGTRSEGTAQFWSELKDCGFTNDRDKRGRLKVVPSIEEVKRQLKME